MSIIEKKINDVKVIPIKLPEITQKVKGGNLFENVYGNIFISAKKKSGKTNLIANILKRCTSKDTIIYTFVSSINVDAVWLHIKDYFDKKGIEFHGFQSIKDNEGKDILADIISVMEDKNDEEETKTIFEPVYKSAMFDKGTITESVEMERKEVIQPKPKYIAPEAIFVFDDISAELRNSKSLTKLLKQNRHYKSKVIVSSQYVFDLKPEQRQQSDYMICFGGIKEEKMKTIFKDLSLHIDEDELYNIYSTVTSQPYNFLYIDVRNSRFRKNFNIELSIK